MEIASSMRKIKLKGGVGTKSLCCFLRPDFLPLPTILPGKLLFKNFLPWLSLTAQNSFVITTQERRLIKCVSFREELLAKCVSIVFYSIF
jgi:hypothetical protein